MLEQDINSADNAELHDELENIPSNKSNNRPFADIVNNSINRRTVLQGSFVTAAAGFFTPAISAKGLGLGKKTAPTAGDELVGFKPVAISDVLDTTMPTISDDYQYEVIIPWGTPIEPGITVEYNGDPNSRPTSAEAALQVGIGHDGMWFFPRDAKPGRRLGNDNSSEGMLCINHEFGRDSHVLGKDDPESLEDVRLSQNAHGVSVLKLKRNPVRGWRVMPSRNSRRITVNTPVAFSGPAAGTELLENVAGNIALGTVNNCGSGPTPWGTYLTCEENFNGYFGANAEFVPTASEDRYGFTSFGFGYGWHVYDARFDLTNPDFRNEQNRFGWIVEIDPNDGTQMPVKRTAMGRFKHEAVAIAESASGRIAAYMGDDQRFDYCYKYVSDEAWEDAIAGGRSPLDDGTLYVARFDEDGTGAWLPIVYEGPLAETFDSEADMLVNTRIAADILGATPMDRPEWTTIGANGEVFWTLTNNSRRTEADAANPEAPNNDGHIIRTVDADDHLGTTFVWDIYILASSTRGTEGVFTDGDLAYCDEDGRLFIGTDGGQPDGLQDQLTVIDTTKENPEPKRLLVGVNSDEVTGFTMTPDRRTAFVNLQHPGNGNPISTNFPAEYDGITIPRDCTLVITKKDGGIIGS